MLRGHHFTSALTTATHAGFTLLCREAASMSTLPGGFVASAGRLTALTPDRPGASLPLRSTCWEASRNAFAFSPIKHKLSCRRASCICFSATDFC